VASENCSMMRGMRLSTDDPTIANEHQENEKKHSRIRKTE
jgi:hypothetical protein